MSSGGDNQQDLAAMKILLTSWHVEILYELFKEEDITIEELKMMQFTHINSLLKNYKMGVRIRFEHHLNNWRTKIGLPLRSEEVQHHSNMSCCCHYKENIGNGSFSEYHHTATNNTNSATKLVTKRKRLQQDETIDHNELEENESPLSPHSIKSENVLNQTLAPTELINLPSATDTGSVGQQTNDQCDETETDNLTLNAFSELLSNSVNEKPPKFPSKQTPDKCPVNLAQILQLSGSRGMSIVKFYKEKKRLTNIHRAQLIQTIVEFFDENDYHLSLNVSHNLEWEILKMFPTEKLEYYRTEKRGKIYVKHCNMKRYKRERNIKVKSEIDSLNFHQRRALQNQLDGLVVENGSDMDADFEWPVAHEPEIEVKEEHLSE